MSKEVHLFLEYLNQKNLKSTKQRVKILEKFLEAKKHLSAEELYRMIRQSDPFIGYTTVYRTLKLICEAGLAQEVDFGDGFTRFERSLGQEHHDHLICLQCGSFVEVLDPELERLQTKLAKRHKFIPTKHKMQIFGYCKKCKKNT
ncbi:Fur family transcriptional regulator [Candidatus Omnitrophota bacterium]